MKLGKFGVFVFTDPLDAAGLAELAHKVEDLGYSALWYPEALNYETFAIAGYLLGNSSKLIVGSGIANIYARDPAASAMGHNSLNSLYGGRYILGLGVSHQGLVNDMRGQEYSDKPLTAMRKYVEGIEQAWTTFGITPASKQIVLAALGPRMSELAAEETMGAFPYNVTPEQATLSRKAMGGKGTLICEQKVCVTEDIDLARQIGRGALGFYLDLPNYRNNWFRLGFTEDDLSNGGSDRFIDAMVYSGTAAEIKQKLEAYFEHGADHVCIQPLRADGQPGPDYAALEALAP